MKKGLIIAIVAAAVLLGGFLWIKGTYNRMVTADEGVSAAWAQVENVYQRRADLIPNLVATVKGYAAHEATTLEDVTAARARATQVVVDPSDLEPEDIARFNKAQGELSSALGRLLMITENYPDLKANQNFLELQAQLEGTENRIKVERDRYNEAVKTFNVKIRRFPTNILASLFGFEKRSMFEAQEGAELAPEVKF